MPKFSNSELEVVKNSIYEKGRDLFIKYGLKKTSIDDIVQACEIGKGSFYKFYPSKEELYFEILKQEEGHYYRIIDKVIGSGNNGNPVMIELIKKLWEAYTSNEFLNLFYERKEVALLLRKISSEDVTNYIEAQRTRFIDHIRELQKQHRIGKIEPELIEGVIRAILILSTHQKEIGKDIYEDVMNLIIHFVGVGLEEVKMEEGKR